MTINFIRTIKVSKRNAFVILGMVAIFGGSSHIWSQVPAPTPKDDVGKPESEPDQEKPEPGQAAQTIAGLKVVFDEAAPGVIIIESEGKKFRVDSNKRTVEVITDASAENLAQNENAETAAAEQVENPDQDEEGSVWDFDKGEEPFDYRIVNVPTPKSVPKGSWNLSFSHRFSQPIHPVSSSGRTLLGFDSFSISSFAVAYGITDKLYVNVARSPLCRRGLCRTVEVGFGYHWLDQGDESPIALTTYASVEGDENFSRNYTYNLQTMISRRVGKRVYLFFSPAVHFNSNGQRRFNPRAQDFFPPAQAANTFHLPKHTGSFGFGTAVGILPDLFGLFEFTPRVGFKLGRVNPIRSPNFSVIGFENISEPAIGFGIQKNIGNHSFILTFSNTQTTTTSRYNSSNLTLRPRRLIIGFNLFRRF